MRVLVISDTHYENEIMLDIVNRYKGKVDLMVHCGDHSLPLDDPLLDDFDVVVKGNHDWDDFPKYVVKDKMFITHGHFFDIYHGFNKVLEKAKENDCRIILFGHTHIPYHTVIDGIHIINPGAVLINRGPYGYGTYVILEYDDTNVTVHYYHHTEHYECSKEVLEAGKETMKEIAELVKKIDEKMKKNF